MLFSREICSFTLSGLYGKRIKPFQDPGGSPKWSKKAQNQLNMMKNSLNQPKMELFVYISFKISKYNGCFYIKIMLYWTRDYEEL